MTTTKSGYLLIADITGYTAYLSASELEHAQDTLSALLELLIAHTRPPLIISRLAGDAVISYALADQFLQGQTFVEMIEDTYVAFRKAINLMVLNNTCRCAACANVSSLDLKFFVHYGTFGLQRLSAHDELVGSDVIVIHRLLKNHVTENTGFRAYTLYTDAAIKHMGLEEICTTMQSLTETYEHLGDIAIWVQDMHPVWERKRDATRITLAPNQIGLQVETEINMPPHLVWDYLAQPEYRKTLIGSDSQRILNREQGRVAPGSVVQCFHGKRIVLQTILEWRPFEQMTSEDMIMPKTTALVDFRLSPTERGTRLVQTFSKPRGPLITRVMLLMSLKVMVKTAQRDIDAFKQRIESDLDARGGEQTQIVEVASGEIQKAAAESLTQG